MIFSLLLTFIIYLSVNGQNHQCIFNVSGYELDLHTLRYAIFNETLPNTHTKYMYSICSNNILTRTAMVAKIVDDNEYYHIAVWNNEHIISPTYDEENKVWTFVHEEDTNICNKEYNKRYTFSSYWYCNPNTSQTIVTSFNATECDITYTFETYLACLNIKDGVITTTEPEDSMDLMVRILIFTGFAVGVIIMVLTMIICIGCFLDQSHRKPSYASPPSTPNSPIIGPNQAIKVVPGLPIFKPCLVCDGRGKISKSIRNPVEQCNICQGLGRMDKNIPCDNVLCDGGWMDVVETAKKDCDICLGTGQLKKRNTPRPMLCDLCNGKGQFAEEEDKKIECDECNGKGVIKGKVNCTHCLGVYYQEYIIKTDVCGHCNGDGNVVVNH